MNKNKLCIIIAAVVIILIIIVCILIYNNRAKEVDAPYGPEEITVEETDSSFGPLEQELND